MLCSLTVVRGWLLQDRVPAFSAEKAISFIEKELGQPVDVLFSQFERQPIAAASLGQVNFSLSLQDLLKT